MAAVLEQLDLVQHLVAVERADVAGLRRGQATDGPAEMHEVRLDRMRQRMHSDLFRQAIALSRITGAASGDDVVPVVRTAARQGDQVIARERLAELELRRVAAAVLATVAVAREEEGVGDLASEPTRDVNELREANDGGAWHREAPGADNLILVRFDNFGLPIDHEAQSPPHRDHGERLEGRVQSQTANDHANLRYSPCASRSTARTERWSARDGTRHLSFLTTNGTVGRYEHN